MLEPRVQGKDIVVEIDMLEQASPVAIVIVAFCAVAFVVAAAVMLNQVRQLVAISGGPEFMKGLAGLLESLKSTFDKAPAVMIPFLVITGLLLLMLLLPKSVAAAKSAFRKSES
jgi:hypothetical protein